MVVNPWDLGSLDANYNMGNMVVNPWNLGSLDARYMSNMVVNPWDLGSLDANYNMGNMAVNPWDLGSLDASYNMGNMAVNPWDLGSLDASYNMSNMVVNPWDLLSIRYLVSKLTLSNEQKRRFLFSLSCSAHKQQQHIMHGNCLKGPSRIVEPEPEPEPEPRASDLSANAAGAASVRPFRQRSTKICGENLGRIALYLIRTSRSFHTCKADAQRIPLTAFCMLPSTVTQLNNPNIKRNGPGQTRQYGWPKSREEILAFTSL